MQAQPTCDRSVVRPFFDRADLVLLHLVAWA